MTKYEIIFEALQKKVDCGELTVEQAEELNTLAYERHSDVNVITLEEYLDTIEEELFGEATRLAKEIDKKAIASNKEFIKKNSKDMEKYHDGRMGLNETINFRQKIEKHNNGLPKNNSLGYGQRLGRYAMGDDSNYDNNEEANDALKDAKKAKARRLETAKKYFNR